MSDQHSDISVGYSSNRIPSYSSQSQDYNFDDPTARSQESKMTKSRSLMRSSGVWNTKTRETCNDIATPESLTHFDATPSPLQEPRVMNRQGAVTPRTHTVPMTRIENTFEPQLSPVERSLIEVQDAIWWSNFTRDRISLAFLPAISKY